MVYHVQNSDVMMTMIHVLGLWGWRQVKAGRTTFADKKRIVDGPGKALGCDEMKEVAEFMDKMNWNLSGDPARFDKAAVKDQLMCNIMCSIMLLALQHYNMHDHHHYRRHPIII